MYSTPAKIIAAIVVFIFTWTCGGVFSLAHAAQVAVNKEQTQDQNKTEKADEKFARITSALEETLADPKADVAQKKKILKESRAEIETVDVAIRKEFADTEKKLKDTGLPEEILERHRRFVKHYDDNLTELKSNFDRVEKAKDEKDAKTALEKVEKQLKQVKGPLRYHPLDPNNLPFRQPKAQQREPRMKKEEFQQEIKKGLQAWRNQRRIMIASTGDLAGLLGPDELAETIEVQFTPDIQNKAAELGNDPVKIYEWVRNNIEFTPAWGSIQGAQLCLETKQGNAFDTASLLIALLRAAGILPVTLWERSNCQSIR